MGSVTPVVLIVDDERVVAVALSRQLRRRGVHVLVIEDPTEVEATIAAHGVTAVVCDKRMPLRSGVEVLVAIKERYPAIARCLLTGSLSELTQEDAERLSPCVLINKPWSEDDLEKLVRAWSVGVR